MGGATRFQSLLVMLVAALTLMQPSAAGEIRTYLTRKPKTHKHYFTVEMTNVTRDCTTVAIPTVNGQLPGPTIHINQGDRLIINVTSKIQDDVSIHWHGINQLLTNWADGVAHITQCPLRYGESYLYDFSVPDQWGTYFYHGHVNWLRATVYGALIVHPTDEPPYPKPKAEIPIIFGEWFNRTPNVVEQEGLANYGLGGFNNSNANTLNGQPGPLYNCSKGAAVVKVQQGKTYLLQLVNAALNSNLFFAVANHTMTVVAADGLYVKQFNTSYLTLQPGQSTDVLLPANQPIGEYYFGVREWAPVPIPGDVTTPSVGFIEYHKRNKSQDAPTVPTFPDFTDDTAWHDYEAKLKNYDGPQNPYDLPKTMDSEFFLVTALASVECIASETCITKTATTINNITFVDPTNTSILQAYYDHTSNGVFTTNFPTQPPLIFDFVAATNSSPYAIGKRGTRVISLNFNQTVQIVLQDVYVDLMDDHPFHLHGHNFFVVGLGSGNYNATTDDSTFNLVDPPARNTVGVPKGGWVAIRFRANNPGAWLYHCHIERHLSWGMETVFITKNGNGPNATLPGPPYTPPRCFNTTATPKGPSTSTSVGLVDTIWVYLIKLFFFLTPSGSI